jgi:imidazolonepropionase-like amidohydrolase
VEEEVMRPDAAFLPIILASLAAAAGAAEPAAVLVRARRIHTVAGPAIDGGAVLVRDGKIVEVGRDIRPPEGARVVEVPGEVMPGLVDAASTLGIPRSPAEEFRELTPEMRAIAAVDRDARDLDRALRSGVTAAGITPGGRNVIGGLGAVIKTVPGRRAADVVKADAFLQASLGREAAAGNLSLRSSPPSSYLHRLPTTRMGTVFLLRRASFEALDLARPPGLDLQGESGLARLLVPEGKEVLAGALRGKRPFLVEAGDRQEIEAALRIAEEFGARFVLVGFAEGMDLVERVREKGFRILLDPGIEPGLDPAVARVTLRLPAILDGAGVEFAFASGRGGDVDRLRERLVLVPRTGVAPERILRAATLGAARILGVEDRIGSIEPGKDADLVALRGGGPLDATAAVEWVMVDGVIHDDARN